MTSVVLNAGKKDPTDDLLYFDDFLGDGDLDLFNRSKVGTSSCITANRPMRISSVKKFVKGQVNLKL